jgi:hypothetical protein
MTPYELFLLSAFILLFVSLAAIIVRSRKIPVARNHSVPRGSGAAGILYAFTLAFAPWTKESARRHLPTYMASVVFHIAVFALIGLLAASLVTTSWDPQLRAALAVLFALGLACGLGLLVKRTAVAVMRKISTAEDYLTNLLVDIALAAGISAAVEPVFIPLFQVVGALLLLFAPLGKLRHMVFLITSRWHWGKFYGRRGIRPSPLKSR